MTFSADIRVKCKNRHRDENGDDNEMKRGYGKKKRETLPANWTME